MTEISQTIIETLDKMHEMSMSDDPHEAVTGRCLKEFYEAFDAFDQRECERGVPRAIIIYGMVHTMGIIAATTAISAAKPGCKSYAVQSTIELFTAVVNDIAHAKKNRRVDGGDT